MRAFMPRGLFARTLIILVAPLLILQLIVATIFVQRHLQGISRQMTANVAGELVGFASLVGSEADDAVISGMVETFSQNVGYDISWLRDDDMPVEKELSFWRFSDRAMTATFRNNIPYPLSVDPDRLKKRVDVRMQLPTGILLALVPERRLTGSNPHFLLVWMGVTSLSLATVAILFLRNQVRPIRQLALAAEAFGKGQPVPNFKPTGAEEVRRAASAFITMRARIDRQIAQRTMMLSGVSHDLRTPLTRMRLSLAMMDQDDEIEALQSDVDQMAQMVESFLAFARGEEGAEIVEADLAGLVRDQAASARKVGANISMTLPDGPILVPLRVDIIRRAIANLIENAAKYGRSVHVSVDAVLEGRRATVVVEDDGPGIPQGMEEAAFRPFFRLDQARNQDGPGGTGLGLTIARDAARAHGGDVSLGKSRALGGLRAVLSLPT